MFAPEAARATRRRRARLPRARRSEPHASGIGIGAGRRRDAESRSTTITSPICARSRCRAWSRSTTCRRSRRPRRCCIGMRVIAFAPIAARRPTMSQGGWRRDCPQCQRAAFSAHRSGGDHARDRRRQLPARPAVALRARHVVVPRRFRRAGRKHRGGGAPRDAARKPAFAAGACAISPRSPGRFLPR